MLMFYKGGRGGRVDFKCAYFTRSLALQTNYGLRNEKENNEAIQIAEYESSSSPA